MQPRHPADDADRPPQAVITNSRAKVQYFCISPEFRTARSRYRLDFEGNATILPVMSSASFIYRFIIRHQTVG